MGARGMARIHIEAERTVEAKPEDVYAILSDYTGGHQSILPQENFKDFAVEEGGVGAGTVLSFKIAAGGRLRPFRMRVSEPERGRVLEEKDLDSSAVTTFTVKPAGGERRSQVRIVTEWEGAKGVGGFFERTFAPGALKRIYDKELTNLAEKARE